MSYSSLETRTEEHVKALRLLGAFDYITSQLGEVNQHGISLEKIAGTKFAFDDKFLFGDVLRIILADFLKKGRLSQEYTRAFEGKMLGQESHPLAEYINKIDDPDEMDQRFNNALQRFNVICNNTTRSLVLTHKLNPDIQVYIGQFGCDNSLLPYASGNDVGIEYIDVNKNGENRVIEAVLLTGVDTKESHFMLVHDTKDKTKIDVPLKA